MAEPHVVILGAGPAGVGAAYQLRRRRKARVTVIERNQAPGGNAGSFEAGGQRLDYGSHRLHHACDPSILADIRSLLGADLLERPRHGRILLRGHWIHFPLRPLDLMLRLDRRFALLSARDMLTSGLGRRYKAGGSGTFASVLLERLGPTICHEFYFPYARKIWGREPEELSEMQAWKRVSASGFGRLIRKILRGNAARGPRRDHFYYPRRGFGQISEAYAGAAHDLGADMRMGAEVVSLSQRTAPGTVAWQVTVSGQDGASDIDADHVWSTLPVTVLARLVNPAPASDVLAAAERLSYRAMLLVYLELPVEHFSEYDAHYFPGTEIRITRLSEPKNYSGSSEPAGRTTICAELPCSPDDDVWSLDDSALADSVASDLARAGIPLPRAPVSVHVRRLRQAYPVYSVGYEHPFHLLDGWAESLPNLLTYGRQGLFAHDNTHHALAMAYGAVDCLGEKGFDHARWREYRRVFAEHVVED